MNTFLWKNGAVKSNFLTRPNLKRFIAKNYTTKGTKGKNISLSGLETRIKEELKEHSIESVIELLKNTLNEIEKFKNRAEPKLSTIIMPEG